MGLFNWLGFGRPRDGPEMDGRASLPEVTDRVRDSGQTYFFGTASSGSVWMRNIYDDPDRGLLVF